MFLLSIKSASVLALLICGFLISFILSFAVGANDVANFFGTIYGTGALTFRYIAIMGSLCELTGALTLGNHVSDTIRKGIINFDSLKQSYGVSEKCLYPIHNQNVTATSSKPGFIGCAELIVMEMSISALIGSAVWLFIANFLRLPVSTTHSIVGSTLGAGLVALEGRGVSWLELGFIVASWVISPIMSGVISAIVYYILWKFIMDKENSFELMLKVTPAIYFLTIAINVFSVVFRGSPLLGFDKVPLYGTIILSLGLGIIAALVCVFVINPTTKKRILKKLGQNATTPEITEMQKESDKRALSSDHTTDTGLMDNAENQRMNPKLSPELRENQDSSNSRKLAILFSTVRSCKDPRTDELFVILQILIACFGSFVHGGNDISNSIAPLLSIWQVYSTQEISSKALPTAWILFYGGAGIVIGLIMMGSRVIRTIGTKITKLTPSSSFAVEFGAALTVLIATKASLPISTTHCQVGSVVFIGIIQQGFKSIDYRLMVNIVISWLVTLPVAGLVSGGAFYAIRYFIFFSLRRI